MRKLKLILTISFIALITLIVILYIQNKTESIQVEEEIVLDSATVENLDYQESVLNCIQNYKFDFISTSEQSLFTLSHNNRFELLGKNENNQCMISHNQEVLSVAKSDLNNYFEELLSTIILDGYTDAEARRIINEKPASLTDKELEYLNDNFNLVDGKTLKEVFYDLQESSYKDMMEFEGFVDESICYGDENQLLSHISNIMNNEIEVSSGKITSNGVSEIVYANGISCYNIK